MLRYLHVCKADNGEASVYDSRDKFAAGFVSGKWVLDHMFSFYDQEERLNLVQDDEEALRILAEARAALNQPFKELSDDRAKSF
ncbi:MAG: hypothetical protein IT343_07465 [Candidatus Melainabacteria bacterium]|jgi:hypothetical protein|nr:hypothetical protein [Candidatus Melainabacteria bacterium]